MVMKLLYFSIVIRSVCRNTKWQRMH